MTVDETLAFELCECLREARAMCANAASCEQILEQKGASNEALRDARRQAARAEQNSKKTLALGLERLKQLQDRGADLEAVLHLGMMESCRASLRPRG